MKRILLAAALTVSAASVGAQSTRYYIHDGDRQTGFIVQNGSVLSTYSLASVGGYPLYPLRFSGGNFLVANRSGGAGVEFDAAGNPTGNTVNNGPQNFDQLLDGATDGVNTYAARCCSGADGIYKGDMQFGGLTQISGLGNSGVTYASSIGSLFAVDFSGNLLQLSTSGTLLNSYSTGINYASSLAYEQSTNTLWFAQNGSGQLYQYDLNGNQLQSFNVAGLQGYNYWAGEMDGAGVSTVPEPATVALFAPALLGIVGIARRRRQQKA